MLVESEIFLKSFGCSNLFSDWLQTREAGADHC